MSSAAEPPLDDGDLLYIEKTLRHAPTDLLLDDYVSGEILRTTWWRSVKVALGTFVLFAFIWLGSGGGPFARSAKDESSSVLVIGLLLGIALFAVTWIRFLRSEKKEAVGEWNTLLAGKAGAADSVYSHIAGRLRDRQLPIHNYLVKRTPTTFGTTGNRLVLIDGYHHVYVSVFAYGTGLYLGWTMWRIRRGSVLFQQYFNMPGRGDNFDSVGRILNLERLKAMREAVHAVCREALHTAVKGIAVAETYGFPSGMPAIERLPFTSAPPAVGPNAHARPRTGP
ncbi:hypothetical protein [Actinocrispum wychmicini]|uniref:Uncharacterized protein n=1 Tax=Actinocrispum wychmicini TaxID=1213861 RepID=A0A4R2IRQ3_9PSEU|nr:hypothetical protein [Actinocrispum wychmicini]TCO47412.1 hypothetical protein EV192_117152 [Actinocrispum wychmicini]